MNACLDDFWSSWLRIERRVGVREKGGGGGVFAVDEGVKVW